MANVKITETKKIEVETVWRQERDTGRRDLVCVTSSVADGKELTDVSFEMSSNYQGVQTIEEKSISLPDTPDKMACLRALCDAISETLEELEKILPAE